MENYKIKILNAMGLNGGLILTEYDKYFRDYVNSVGGGGSGGGTSYSFTAPLSETDGVVSINLSNYATTTSVASTVNDALTSYVKTTDLTTKLNNYVSNTTFSSTLNTTLLPYLKQNDLFNSIAPLLVAGSNIDIISDNINKKLTINSTATGLDINGVLAYKDTTATDFNDSSLDGALFSLSQGQSNTMLNSPAGNMPMTLINFVNKVDLTANFFAYQVAIGKTTNTNKTNVFIRKFSNTAGINGDPATRVYDSWVRMLTEPDLVPAMAEAINDTNNTDLRSAISSLGGGSGGGGGGSTASGMNSADAFIFRERISNVNWTVNAGTNTFFNFTDEFATQGVVNQDTNFFTGANPYFIYDSATQSLRMRSDIVNEHIEFLISGRFSYNGGSGSEFAFVLGRPSTSSNTSTGILETSVRTQGQNVQTTQTRSNGMNIHTRLLSTTDGSDPYQTEGFKIGFFNYSTGTGITITDASLTISIVNRIKF